MGRNNLVGAWGEAQAAEYLKKKKYRILATNFRCRFGEIDIIAEKASYIAFVEVKLRKDDRFASAAEFVNTAKQERIKTTAQLYLSQFPTSAQPRFDVIEIYAPEGLQTQKPVINHMEDAFE